MNDTLETAAADEQARRVYRAVWRWHFYAGIFCIPLVIWLSCTGSIYLFKPQIERWLDRPYDHFEIHGLQATPEQIANVALRAVPHSSLHYYELPPSANAATRVIVGVGSQEFRVYIHPQTLQILKIIDEDKRPMRIIFRLHGELLAGDWGSRVVELAASWAIVLIVSGLYLWWPRQGERLAGVFWIRFRRGSRIFWRDLHAVTGLWISAFALFLLLTGLPWAKSWGTYFQRVRQITGTAVALQDWTIGRSSELAEREGLNRNSVTTDAMDHSNHVGHAMSHLPSNLSLVGMNRVVSAATALHLASPVLITPSAKEGAPWVVKSDAQNRTLRTIILMNPNTAAIVNRQDFNQRHIVDRVLGVGIAAHEGQLFGLANQLLGLITAMGLVALSLSAIVLWWRRRHVGVLGAPLPTTKPRWSIALVAVIVVLALYLPAMAASLVTVIMLEKLLFSRVPQVSRWLGLSTATRDL
ncbi:PepSY-associated TM helix domain-containing protein [Edaphobacter albus]|uniref:PepSY-associated TM helix domain-containing protein n=1 Tax=Edaphobacter sp. 4G125 TaxID=2763071 RepID=UPI001644630F|nr:PepSY domain-containing protein [Edaphobacter sp. 4G125]QNI38197.1 PepSY domain-containing protein [Edaphobacter sp. 4G125]